MTLEQCNELLAIAKARIHSFDESYLDVEKISNSLREDCLCNLHEFNEKFCSSNEHAIALQRAMTDAVKCFTQIQDALLHLKMIEVFKSNALYEIREKLNSNE